MCVMWKSSGVALPLADMVAGTADALDDGPHRVGAVSGDEAAAGELPFLLLARQLHGAFGVVNGIDAHARGREARETTARLGAMAARPDRF